MTEIEQAPSAGSGARDGAERDLRGYLERLDRDGDLLTVTRPVDRRSEAPALIAAAMDAGKVIRFEHVAGADYPVVGSVLGSRELLARALGTTTGSLHEEFSARIAHPLRVRQVSDAPVKEVVEHGPDTDAWPLLVHRADDVGPYITAGVAVARDPIGGRQNLSYNRMQRKSGDRFGFSMLATHDLARFYAEYCRRDEPMQVAVCLGLHPIELLSAAVRTESDELEVAGALRGEPVEVVRCETSDLLVPAHAELVLEGEIVPGHFTEEEGPFGDWLGYYQVPSQRHVFRLRCVTRRERPYFVSMLAASREDHLLLGFPREVEVLHAARNAVPGVKRVHMYPFLLNCVIQMDKRFDGEPQIAAYAAISVCPWIRNVIVVDEDVDPTSMDDVMWAVATRCKADEDLDVLHNALGFVRDKTGIYRHKVVIDATVAQRYRGDLAFKRVREVNRGELRLADYVD